MRRSTMRFAAKRATAGDGNVGSTRVALEEGAISSMGIWQHVVVLKEGARKKAIRCCDTPSKTLLGVCLLVCRWFSG
jgi:hypothetical protein